MKHLIFLFKTLVLNFVLCQISIAQKVESIENKKEFNHNGNISKDLEKGVLSVKYLDIVTKELDLSKNLVVETKNYLTDEIVFIDQMKMKINYNSNFKVNKIELIYQNQSVLALDKSSNITYGYSNQIGKFLYEVNFNGGRGIPYSSFDYQNSEKNSSYIYDFTSKNLKNQPKISIDNLINGVSVSYDFTVVDRSTFNTDDFENQRRPINKFDTLQKGYYFDEKVFRLKAYIERHSYGNQFNYENNKIKNKISNIKSNSISIDNKDLNFPINIFDKIEVYSATNKGYIEVIGMFNGEFYADSEMYIFDAYNQKIWLGRDIQNSQSSDLKKSDSNFIKIRIMLDSNLQFKGVNNGLKYYTIDKWNEKFSK